MKKHRTNRHNIGANSSKVFLVKKCKTAYKTFILLSTFLFLSAFPALARGWVRDTASYLWRYDLGNGNYCKSTWQWIDDKQSGVAKCYRFDQNGFLLTNTVTADGCSVNENGEWTVNNVVQTKPMNATSKIASSPSVSQSLPIKKEVLDKINQYRVGSSLSSLDEKESLDAIAEVRAQECAVSFSHTRPQGGSVLNENDVYGEILACNMHTPEKTVQAWEDSPTHNHVMLVKDFESFGSGYYVDGDGNDYCVVLFSYYD